VVVAVRYSFSELIADRFRFRNQGIALCNQTFRYVDGFTLDYPPPAPNPGQATAKKSRIVVGRGGDRSPRIL